MLYDNLYVNKSAKLLCKKFEGIDKQTVKCHAVWEGGIYCFPQLVPLHRGYLSLDLVFAALSALLCVHLFWVDILLVYCQQDCDHLPAFGYSRSVRRIFIQHLVTTLFEL